MQVRAKYCCCSARKNLLNVFPGLVDADLVKLKADVKANAEVVEVTFQ